MELALRAGVLVAFLLLFLNYTGVIPDWVLLRGVGGFLQ